MSRGKDDNIIQSVMRASEVLEVLERANRDLGISEMSREMGLHKSTVYGIVNSLAHKGLVEQDPTSGKYRLGIRLFEMGHRLVERLDLQIVARPVLESLVEQFKETAHLVVRNGAEVVYIAKRESERSVRIVSQVGQRLPCYCTGVGKAVLAALSEEEVDALYQGKSLEAYTGNTITDLNALKQELRTIRAQGYALDHGEIDVSIRCVAAAIRDVTGQPVGAISISGPAERMSGELMMVMAESIADAAKSLSRRLG